MSGKRVFLENSGSLQQITELQLADLYEIMKGKAYALAITVGGRSNAEAKSAGYRDAYDLIMSDSDHIRQQMFLMMLADVLPEGHRRIFLDGLAREYAGVPDWAAYVDRETS